MQSLLIITLLLLPVPIIWFIVHQHEKSVQRRRLEHIQKKLDRIEENQSEEKLRDEKPDRRD